jgi:hypothetical protein
LKYNKPRRTPEVLVRPEKKLGPAPSLFPTGAWKIVLSRLGTIVTTSAWAPEVNATNTVTAVRMRMALATPWVSIFTKPIIGFAAVIGHGISPIRELWLGDSHPLDSGRSPRMLPIGRAQSR